MRDLALIDLHARISELRDTIGTLIKYSIAGIVMLSSILEFDGSIDCGYRKWLAYILVSPLGVRAEGASW